jgi:hypothetical protein
MGKPGAMSWNELLRAMDDAKIFANDDAMYSKNMMMRFSRYDGGRNILDEVGIFIPKGIDNCYDKENGWRWEIKLNADGTWRIV